MKSPEDFKSPKEEIIKYLYEEGYNITSIGNIEVKGIGGDKKFILHFKGHKGR